MSLRASIHSALMASTGVTDLIAARHYAGRVPQNPISPCVISELIVSNAQSTHGNASDAEDSLDESLIQFDCYAESLSAANALCLAVRRALFDPTETASAAIISAAGIVVSSPVQRDVYDTEADLFGVSLDLTFHHNPNS